LHFYKAEKVRQLGITMVAISIYKETPVIVQDRQNFPQIYGHTSRSYYGFTLAHYGLIIWKNEASAYSSRSRLSVFLQGEQSIALVGFAPTGLVPLRGTPTDLAKHRT